MLDAFDGITLSLFASVVNEGEGALLATRPGNPHGTLPGGEARIAVGEVA